MPFKPDEFIAIDTQGIAEIKTALDRLPKAVIDEAIPAVNKYLVDGLRAYEPYKYVSRKQAYGRTFQSDKQRRWFFAALKSGELKIPYRRTQTLSRGWKPVGSGANQIIANETPYADWVYGDHQSRMMAKRGYKKLDEFVKQRMEKIIKVFEGAAIKAGRKLGLDIK